MIGNLLEPEIRTMIREHKFDDLKEVFAKWTPTDLAELITELPAQERVVVFRMLPDNLASITFEYLRSYEQRSLLRAMGKEDVAKIINEMSPDDRTRLLEELPATALKELLQLLSPNELEVAKGLLGYPEKSVGRLMTPDFVTVKDDWTAQQVLDYIREHGKDSETLDVIYVIDDRGNLIDDVRIREFLLRPVTAKVSEIRDHTFVALSATESEDEAIRVFRKYDRTALPVVDSKGKLVGIVTVDDVLDVVEREATSDIQMLGGTRALDEPYLSVRLPEMVRKRAPWLVVLFLSEMLTATAMGFFENEIAKAVVLALFVPLIISSGGNSGSQATTLVIRAMALGEVRLADWWRVMRREIFSGLSLGVILGSIGFLRIALWSAFSKLYGPHWPLIGLTIFGSLIGVVMWGTLSGSMLPFLLRRCGFDPATASAPFVATLVDVTGLVIYFTMAMLVLRGTVL
jgi:magnesium transporter